jgi:hypothetical protein
MSGEYAIHPIWKHPSWISENFLKLLKDSAVTVCFISLEIEPARLEKRLRNHISPSPAPCPPSPDPSAGGAS